MTRDERFIVINLGKVSILPGGFDKRFIRQLIAIESKFPEKELSERQKEWMFRLLYKYRRQIPNTYEVFKSHPHCNKLIQQK